MLRWFKCKHEGDVPSARDSHSATLANNQVYIFGGQDNNENLLNDFYKVTLQHTVKTIQLPNQQPTHDKAFKLVWQRIDVNLAPGIPWPVVRSSHSMNIFMERFLVLIGGETTNDETEVQEIKPQASTPNSQEDDDENEASNKPLNDVWLFDIFQNYWQEITPQVKVQQNFNSKKMKKNFESRMAHSANVHGPYIIIFGGFNSQTKKYSSNNLCLLSLLGCSDSMLLKPYSLAIKAEEMNAQRES